MNHCLLEVKIKKAPTVRYTQDNKTPIAEMEVIFEGLRSEDTPGELKVIGWGNLAQEMQNRIRIGQNMVLEGRLRMNTVPRQDGTKEKQAELTLSKMHFPSQEKTEPEQSLSEQNQNSLEPNPTTNTDNPTNSLQEDVSWDSSPLIPDTDDIPF